MTYTEQEAREKVIEAGLKLVECKLIARTWGNISARISDTQFVITPSGKPYETLKPEDLVVVNIADASYEGNIKPSSEKGVHAAAFALRPNIGFVIHTHQNYASAIGAEGKGVAFAACAPYGLPGTKKLRNNVYQTIKINPLRNKFLLARHGTLCLGDTYEEAFQMALDLEKESQELFEKKKHEATPESMKKAWVDDFAQIVGFGKKQGPKEDAEAIAMITEKNNLAAQYVSKAQPLSTFDTALQRFVYRIKYSKLKNK